MTPRSLFALALAVIGCDDPGIKLDDSGAGSQGTDSATNPSGDDTAPTEPDLSWATVTSCDDRHSGGFNDWVGAGGRAVMVHGNSTDDAELGAEIFVSYSELVGDYFDSFELVAEADLSEADRLTNLFVLGSPDTQPLLAEMDGALPVRFVGGGFVFAGALWDDPENGIALDHPSPFAEDSMILVFAGNSYDGMYNTLTVMTGSEDYHVVEGRGRLVMEGALCMDTDPWSVLVEG